MKGTTHRASSVHSPRRRPGATRALAAIALGAALLPGCQATREPAPIETAAPACGEPGHWLTPQGELLFSPELLASAARADIVLLGESHTRADHHRWQWQTLAGLLAHRGQLVVGFEMFPRTVQPALDVWAGGGYDEEAFLAAVDWYESWGYEPSHYLPLFHFARQNRVPMRALNIPRDLVARIGEQGWNEIPAEARAGLSDPAPAQPDYLFALAEVYRLKAAHQGGSAVAEDAGERGALPTDEGFLHFVDAQLSWDRAMAEGLVAARRAYPEALVVGIMGRGHVDSGYGVPHQLTDLGETSVVSLVPVDVGEPCRTMPPDLADAAFTVPAVRNFHASPPRPRLGVTLEATEGGLAVVDVQAQGVGAAAGLEAGDVIFEAAGLPVAGTGELRAVLARQAWGTWLPLAVRREGHVLELVARFPPRVHDLDAAPDH